MKTRWKIMAAALTLVATVDAFAQSPAVERRAAIKQKMQEKLAEMDSNHDGAISHAEYMAHAEARFKKLDADGDGQITSVERSEVKEKAQQWRKKASVGGYQSYP